MRVGLKRSGLALAFRVAQTGGLLFAALSVALSLGGLAARAAGAEPASGGVTREELEAWLAKDPEEAEMGPDRQELEAPSVAPHRTGVVIEGSAGALGHIGDMQAVSPVAPWFRFQVGYELFDALMILAQADLALANTRLARRPPDSRTYGLFGAGIGARATWRPIAVLGLYLQGEGGVASVTEDVLASYGYSEADRIRPYVGGSVGLEWLQVSPHYGLGLYGGVRDYIQTFERIHGERPPLAWVSGLTIRYCL